MTMVQLQFLLFPQTSDFKVPLKKKKVPLNVYALCCRFCVRKPHAAAVAVVEGWRRWSCKSKLQIFLTLINCLSCMICAVLQVLCQRAPCGCSCSC